MVENEFPTEFYEIIPNTLRREGGLSKNPNDRGKDTNWGVTIGTIRRHNIDVDGDGDIDVDDIKVMPIELAVDIYKKYYWDPSRADGIPAALRACYFDMCVNHGIENAIKILQRAVCTNGPDITVDGIIGPQTLGAAHRVSLKELVYERLSFYGCIMCRDKSQKVFQNGWFNRCLEFLPR